jgi:GNAT superfamily N-acetyltransferase
MEYIIKPLSPDLLQDYLLFFDNMVFEENPSWADCYCYSFHFTGPLEEWKRDSNRSAAIRMINENTLTGYLVFHNDKAVGWCNVNQRSNYQGLPALYEITGDADERVCSVVCFVIHPDHRRKGIARMIIERIIADYTEKGFDYIEAYPAKGEQSAEGAYGGPLKLYYDNGFKLEKEHDKYFILKKKL